MAQVRTPTYGESSIYIGPQIRALSAESNAQDKRIEAIEAAIARIDAALTHFTKEVK